MVTLAHRDFARAVLEIRRNFPVSLNEAKAIVAALLQTTEPSQEEYETAASEVARGPIRRRGAPRQSSLTKRDAVACLAVYFESIGAGKEQAIIEAMRWLQIKISRKVAKAAVENFREMSAPSQYRVLADCAYVEFVNSTHPLPTSISRTRKRRTKSDLG